MFRENRIHLSCNGFWIQTDNHSFMTRSKTEPYHVYLYVNMILIWHIELRSTETSLQGETLQVGSLSNSPGVLFIIKYTPFIYKFLANLERLFDDSQSDYDTMHRQ